MSATLRRKEIVARAPVFAALGDPTRLLLVARLAKGGAVSTTRLHEGFEVSRQAVTKHLEQLEGAGLVRAHREGRERLWELERARVEDARAFLDRISAEWDVALGNLKAFVEK